MINLPNGIGKRPIRDIAEELGVSDVELAILAGEQGLCVILPRKTKGWSGQETNLLMAMAALNTPPAVIEAALGKSKVQCRSKKYHTKRAAKKPKEPYRSKYTAEVLLGAGWGKISLKEVADNLGIAPRMVRYYGSLHGWSSAMDLPRWTQRDEQYLDDAVSVGTSYTKMAYQLNRSVGAVKTRICKLRKQGIIPPIDPDALPARNQ